MLRCAWRENCPPRSLLLSFSLGVFLAVDGTLVSTASVARLQHDKTRGIRRRKTGRAKGSSSGQRAPRQPDSSRPAPRGYPEVLRKPVGAGSPAAELASPLLSAAKARAPDSSLQGNPTPSRREQPVLLFSFLHGDTKARTAREESRALLQPFHRLLGGSPKVASSTSANSSALSASPLPGQARRNKYIYPYRNTVQARQSD